MTFRARKLFGNFEKPGFGVLTRIPKSQNDFSLKITCRKIPIQFKSLIQFNSNLYFDTVKNSSGFGTIYNYITIINNNKYVSKKSYL